MSTIPVNVKWGKEKVDVELAPEQGVKALKTELEEKTGVPTDRMKIMPKSKAQFQSFCDFHILRSVLYHFVGTKTKQKICAHLKIFSFLSLYVDRSVEGTPQR